MSRVGNWSNGIPDSVVGSIAGRTPRDSRASAGLWNAYLKAQFDRSADDDRSPRDDAQVLSWSQHGAKVLLHLGDGTDLRVDPRSATIDFGSGSLPIWGRSRQDLPVQTDGKLKHIASFPERAAFMVTNDVGQCFQVQAKTPPAEGGGGRVLLSLTVERYDARGRPMEGVVIDNIDRGGPSVKRLDTSELRLSGASFLS